MKRIVAILLLLICLCGCAPRRHYCSNSINNKITEEKSTEEILEYFKKERYKAFIKKHAKYLHTVKTDEILDNIYKYGKDDYDREIMLAMFAKESKFYERADSFLGARYGRGIGQVSEIGLKDYNEKNNTEYKPSDLYDIDINIKIAYWIFHHNELYGVVGRTEKIIAYNRGAEKVKRERDNPNLVYYYGVMELYNEIKS